MNKWSNFWNRRFLGGNAGKSAFFGTVFIAVIAITAMLFSSCPATSPASVNTDASAPGAPTGLTVTPAPNLTGVVGSRVMLKWEQPATGYTEDGTPGTISTYTVYYSKTAANLTDLATFPGAPGADKLMHETNNAFTRVENCRT